MFNGKFEDIVAKDDGFLRGPFGSALKKSLFVPKSEDAYKVYEQGVVLEKNSNIGRYYISKDYYENNIKICNKTINILLHIFYYSSFINCFSKNHTKKML